MKIRQSPLLERTIHPTTKPTKKAWNSDRKIGQKKPLNRRQIKQVRNYTRKHESLRNQVLFALGYDSALRSCDLLGLMIGDVIHRDGTVRHEFTIGQDKTHEGVTCVIDRATRKLLAKWIRENGGRWNDPLFPGRTKNGTLGLTQHQRLVKSWVAAIGLNPDDFSSHSIRRSKASILYAKTKNLEIVRHLLGHKTLAAASYYLGVTKQQALQYSRRMGMGDSFRGMLLDFVQRHFLRSRYANQFMAFPPSNVH